MSVPRLDHITVTVTDFTRSAAFYDAALGALGMTRLCELVDEEEDDAPVEAAAWGSGEGDGAGDGQVWLISGDSPTTGLHIRMMTQSQVQVESFWQAGLAAGGSPQHAPRRWTPYRRGEFQAVLGDPEGNLIEAVCPE